MKKEPEIKKISPGEAELLEILWEHGPSTLAQVHEIHTRGSGRPALQTIQTRLNRMVAKGLVSRTGGYPALYVVAVSKEQTRGKFMEMLEEFTGRNLAALMLHLAETRRLTPEEIAALEMVIARSKKMPSDIRNSNNKESRET